ncbi:MAG: hypothetical protein ACXV7D_13115 [Thermoanaerobaculia bacterium]
MSYEKDLVERLAHLLAAAVRRAEAAEAVDPVLADTAASAQHEGDEINQRSDASKEPAA